MNNRLSTKTFDINNRRHRMLIVDDQPLNIRLIHHLFETEFDIFMATNGKQALNVCAHSPPDIILLDVMMPEMDGLQLCRNLKQQPETQTIPVIFITALQSAEDETACWEAGCVDFINKPINPLTLRNRVKAHLLLKLQAEFLHELAFVDGLTGIANRRCFDERLQLEFFRSQRSGQSLALLMIDVDFFKNYNDQYGHQAGDESLRQIATVLHSNLQRSTDLVARYGGEEFACLLPDTDKKGAISIAEKLLTNIQALNIENLSSEVGSVLTISIGVAIYPSTKISLPKLLIKAADAQLYNAKQNGRNKVCSE